VALLNKECDKGTVAEFLKVKPHTAYTYLQQLEKKNILETRSRGKGQLVYSPKFADGIKLDIGEGSEL
jgi:Mn-dependent DtxR family transcriptional regulator